MSVKKTSLTVGSIVVMTMGFGAIFFDGKPPVWGRSLYNVIGPVAFIWTMRAGTLLFVLFFVWAWMSDWKQDRRVERLTNFRASLEPRKHVELHAIDGSKVVDESAKAKNWPGRTN